jgi:hypothetical protein
VQVTDLPADVVDVSLVKKLEHQLVVDCREHPDERGDRQQHQTQDSIGNGVELVVHELAAQPLFLVHVRLGEHVDTNGLGKGSLLTESTDEPEKQNLSDRMILSLCFLGHRRCIPIATRLNFRN